MNTSHLSLPNIPNTRQFCSCNSLSLFWSNIGIFFGITISATRSAFDRSTDHLGTSKLKDLRKGKEGDSIDSQVKRLYRWNISVGGLRNQMASKRCTKVGDTHLKVVLKDLIGGPTVQSRLGIVYIFTIGKNLSLAAVETPRKDDFVLTSAAMRPC